MIPRPVGEMNFHDLVAPMVQGAGPRKRFLLRLELDCLGAELGPLDLVVAGADPGDFFLDGLCRRLMDHNKAEQRRKEPES